MLRFAVGLFLLSSALALPVGPAPPTFPGNYFFEGVFSIPAYGIFEELSVYTSEQNDMQRISYYGGRDVFLTRGDLGMLYEVVPRLTEQVCFSSNVSGPTSNSLNSNIPLAPFLPDLSTWEYAGEEVVRGFACDVYQHQMKNYSMTATYRFAVGKESGFPVQLHLSGFNFIESSHPDVYVLDFNVFLPLHEIPQSIFTVPGICNKQLDAAPTSERVGARVRAVVNRLARLLPPRKAVSSCGSSEFKAFATLHGKTYKNCEEVSRREAVWRQNMDYIARHNARNDKTHTLAPNHFTDLSDDEFRALMLQRRGRASDNKATHTHVADKTADVPSFIDWREKGAVNEPKDQGICGSCWAFGSVGSLEGVNFVKTGKLVSVSEQQVVDCAWGYTWSGPGGNLACDGGYASGAYQWMIDNGGVALEQSYRYTMQDGWCKAVDKSAAIKVTGYVNVSSVDDLIHAVATVGPVAVAIDASHPSFRFYSGGVYYEPECKSDIDSLDHEVLAVGMKLPSENDDGYWIIKNSWSKDNWGEGGFVRMSMKGNNCGVGTQATYPIVA